MEGEYLGPLEPEQVRIVMKSPWHNWVEKKFNDPEYHPEWPKNGKDASRRKKIMQMADEYRAERALEDENYKPKKPKPYVRVKDRKKLVKKPKSKAKMEETRKERNERRKNGTTYKVLPPDDDSTENDSDGDVPYDGPGEKPIPVHSTSSNWPMRTRKKIPVHSASSNWPMRTRKKRPPSPDGEVSYDPPISDPIAQEILFNPETDSEKPEHPSKPMILLDPSQQFLHRQWRHFPEVPKGTNEWLGPTMSLTPKPDPQFQDKEPRPRVRGPVDRFENDDALPWSKKDLERKELDQKIAKLARPEPETFEEPRVLPRNHPDTVADYINDHQDQSEHTRYIMDEMKHQKELEELQLIHDLPKKPVSEQIQILDDITSKEVVPEPNYLRQESDFGDETSIENDGFEYEVVPEPEDPPVVFSEDEDDFKDIPEKSNAPPEEIEVVPEQPPVPEIRSPELHEETLHQWQSLLQQESPPHSPTFTEFTEEFPEGRTIFERIPRKDRYPRPPDNSYHYDSADYENDSDEQSDRRFRERPIPKPKKPPKKKKRKNKTMMEIGSWVSDRSTDEVLRNVKRHVDMLQNPPVYQDYPDGYWDQSDEIPSWVLQEKRVEPIVERSEMLAPWYHQYKLPIYRDANEPQYDHDLWVDEIQRRYQAEARKVVEIPQERPDLPRESLRSFPRNPPRRKRLIESRGEEEAQDLYERQIQQAQSQRMEKILARIRERDEEEEETPKKVKFAEEEYEKQIDDAFAGEDEAIAQLLQREEYESEEESGSQQSDPFQPNVQESEESEEEPWSPPAPLQFKPPIQKQFNPEWESDDEDEERPLYSPKPRIQWSPPQSRPESEEPESDEEEYDSSEERPQYSQQPRIEWSPPQSRVRPRYEEDEEEEERPTKFYLPPLATTKKPKKKPKKTKGYDAQHHVKGRKKPWKRKGGSEIPLWGLRRT